MERLLFCSEFFFFFEVFHFLVNKTYSNDGCGSYSCQFRNKSCIIKYFYSILVRSRGSLATVRHTRTHYLNQFTLNSISFKFISFILKKNIKFATVVILKYVNLRVGGASVKKLYRPVHGGWQIKFISVKELNKSIGTRRHGCSPPNP